MSKVVKPSKPSGDLRSLALTITIVGASLLVVVAGLTIGTRPVPAKALWQVLIHPDGKIDSILVWTLRLPRSLAALLAGAGLSISGFLLQTLTRNPLAGPGLTGVTAGAVAPIVVCFVFLPWLSSIYYPLIGMGGGIAAALVTFWIARGGAGRPLHLALGGISVSMFLGAVTTWVVLASGPQVPSLVFWLSGGFQGRSWAQLVYMIPWVFIGCIGAFGCHRIVGLLALSEHAASGMGLNLRLWKPVLLLLAVLPVAGITPVAGPVAFVGMASPHIARLLKPSGTVWTLALTASIGGLMVVSGDVIARSIAPPRELPISVVTALLAGPVFIWLVQRRHLAVRGQT